MYADTSYCWVYLSSYHAFQGYYKMRQVLLWSATILLQSATEHATLLQGKFHFKHLPSVLFVLRRTLKNVSDNQSAWPVVLSGTIWHIFHAFSAKTTAWVSSTGCFVLLYNGLAVRLLSFFLYDQGSGVSKKINVCSATPFKFTNGKALGTKLVATYNAPIHDREDLSLIYYLFYALYTTFLHSVIY